eukprot:3495692-Pleurochrysis_carterae.AAC.1
MSSLFRLDRSGKLYSHFCVWPSGFRSTGEDADRSSVRLLDRTARPLASLHAVLWQHAAGVPSPSLPVSSKEHFPRFSPRALRSASKLARSLTSYYCISLNSDSISRDSPHYLGKLRALSVRSPCAALCRLATARLVFVPCRAINYSLQNAAY